MVFQQIDSMADLKEKITFKIEICEIISRDINHYGKDKIGSIRPSIFIVGVPEGERGTEEIE